MWGYVIQGLIMLVAAITAYALTPKPKMQSNNLQPQLVTAPTVTAGGPIQVPFGRLRIRNPNLLWYGGQSTSQIKK